MTRGVTEYSVEPPNKTVRLLWCFEAPTSFVQSTNLCGYYHKQAVVRAPKAMSRGHREQDYFVTYKGGAQQC